MFKKTVLAILASVYIISILLIAGCVLISRPEYLGRTMFIPLKSSPEGARVIFEGRQKGFTPITLKFSYISATRGSHDDETRERVLRIEKYGYEPYILLFSIQGKEYEKIPDPIILKRLDDGVKTDDSHGKDRKNTRDLNEGERENKETEKTGKDNTQNIKQHNDTIEDLPATDWFEKGLALGKVKKYKDEIEAYKKAIKIRPDYTEAHYNLVLSYLILGDKDSAIEEYKILQNLDPQKADVLYEKAIGRSSTSKDILQKVTYKNFNNENKLIEKSMAGHQYEFQVIYTIQTGSFIEIERAQKQFESIIESLDKKDLDYLRIEKVGEFYAVRLGKFDDYTAAEKFLEVIKLKHSTAIILKAYIKDERIMRFYNNKSISSSRFN